MRGELEPSMYAWLDLLAWLVVIIILTFSSYQFCRYCYEARMRMIKCIAKLYREFVDDYTSNLPGPRS